MARPTSRWEANLALPRLAYLTRRRCCGGACCSGWDRATAPEDSLRETAFGAGQRGVIEPIQPLGTFSADIHAVAFFSTVLVLPSGRVIRIWRSCPPG